ncbi:chromate transporter, partial [Roseomonas sp. DSM 102946]|nr:chromate transporter [Roseomonas sp. DSM 102946]
MTPVLVSIALIFGELSLLAFGGGNSILPEMQRRVVEVHHWMSAEEFSALFALAQAAPGPNLMVVPLVGWTVAGWPGLAVASAAKFIPSSALTILAVRLWDRSRDRPWRRWVQEGLLPMTSGLVVASGIVITEASVRGIGLALIALACTAIPLRWK